MFVLLHLKLFRERIGVKAEVGVFAERVLTRSVSLYSLHAERAKIGLSPVRRFPYMPPSYVDKTLNEKKYLQWGYTGI